MDDFILIANPISGKGKAKAVAEQAYTALMADGCNGEIKLTTGSGDATRFAQEAVSNEIQWVIACGGDGTLHEVVNGIATVPDVILGLIPCGRGNDLATAVRIPRQPQQAIQTLFTGKSRFIDLGYVRSEKGSEHYFTTITTCGYDTEVSRRAAARTTPFSGTASYVYAAIATLFQYECPSVRIEGDFGVYEDSILLAATGSTKSYGGGFKIVPDAQFDDGLFDVCIIRPVSSFTVLRLMVTLFWGGHVSHPAVEIHQTRSLKIETDPPVMLYADGEPMCETPATIEIIKHGLTVLVPS
ncbi:hypothetical protein C6501_04725 [Candidatus Poribacteria bacterium]|nr:MAG: hypothetical protein C6501_04725 [Candidatus Poribacteria bacterium]